VNVLSAVPDTSTQHLAAQIAAVRARLAASDLSALSASDVADAGARLEQLHLDPASLQTLTIEVLEAGLALVGGFTAGSGQVLTCEPTDNGFRLGLERSYRALARLARTPEERYALIDRANEVRPRTLV